MFSYSNKVRGWSDVWIDKINSHTMISNDTVNFFDEQKFEMLNNYIQEYNDVELFHIMRSIQERFWEEQFTEKLGNGILEDLDKLECRYKQILLKRKFKAIEKDF